MSEYVFIVLFCKSCMCKNFQSCAILEMSKEDRDAVERATKMKTELLHKIDQLGDRLPPNTLDQLIDELGGTENVAEVRVVEDCNSYGGLLFYSVYFPTPSWV